MPCAYTVHSDETCCNSREPIEPYLYGRGVWLRAQSLPTLGLGVESKLPDRSVHDGRPNLNGIIYSINDTCEHVRRIVTREKSRNFSNHFFFFSRVYENKKIHVHAKMEDPRVDSKRTQIELSPRIQITCWTIINFMDEIPFWVDRRRLRGNSCVKRISC